MSFYDIFLKNQHSPFIQNLMQFLNRNLLNFLIQQHGTDVVRLNLLEIGPGKGYFYKACVDYKRAGLELNYYAFDRNKNILKNLGVEQEHCFEGECTDLHSIINENLKFDIVFAGFVIEHLNNGQELFTLFRGIKEILSENGIAVFLCPDSMKLGMEFWNIDYTHVFPTTKRNVAMALRDAGFGKIEIYDINGLCFYPGFHKRFVYLIHRLLVFFYNYRLINFFFEWTTRKEHEIENLFYRIFALIKEENMLIIAR